MTDINKIEAAAKDAHKPDTAMHEIQRHWIMSSPDAVLEMVSMLRERDAVLKQALEALWTTATPKGEEAIAAIKGVLEP